MKKAKNTYFEIQMTFDDDTIRRMFRAEYYTYETVQRLIRFCLGAAGVMAALFAPVPTAAKVVLLMIGVWLLVAGDFPSKVQAEGVISRRGGKSSRVSYHVEPEGLRIKGGGYIAYKNLDKLVYDDEYLYLFVNRQNAVMLPVNAVGSDRLESFKTTVQEKSGGTFKRLTTGALEYNIKDLLEAVDSRKGKKKSNS